MPVGGDYATMCFFCVLQAFVSFIPLNNGETFLNKV